MTRALALFFCLLAPFVVAENRTAENQTAEIQVTDDRGRTLVLERPAQRVVALAPHITEVVFAAGAGELLVGAVSYSDYPVAARDVPRVGSYNSVSLETLVTLKPDIILAWGSGTGDETVARLENLGFKVYVEEPRTLEDVARSLRAVGRLTGTEEQAGIAAGQFLDTLHRLRETYSSREPVSVYYQIWNEPLLTLNDDHIISDVLRLCGGRNVFAEAIPMVSRINVESVIRADPQVIVASGMDQSRPEWLDTWRDWKSMQAVRDEQLYFVPPDILQRHTPRIVQGAQMLCQHLQIARQHYYPRIESAKVPD